MPGALPGWFDVDAIIANALPVPLGGNPNNPHGAEDVSMVGGGLVIDTPEPTTLALLTVAGLALVHRRRS